MESPLAAAWRAMGNLAHDINHILTVVMTETQLVMEYGDEGTAKISHMATSR